MAKIELSGIGIVQMGGKIGDDVIGRNAYGYYRRANNVSGDPDTIYQNNWQSKLRTVTLKWSLLTEEERLMWDSAAASGDWKVGGKLGNWANPTGQCLFIKVNLGAYDYSYPILIPPKKRSFSSSDLPAITSIVPTPTNSLVVNLSTNTIPTSTSCYIWSTGSLSNGIMRPQPSKFKLIYQAPYDAYGNSLEVGPQYVQRFGNMVAGKKIFVKTQLVDWLTGIHIDVSKVFDFT